MTPAARHQTAIEILDAVLAGAPAEQALTRWARASRYAGSKDRAAVRDIVFDALRKRASAAARGGSLTGRGLVLGLLALNDQDPGQVFSGGKYGPDPLSDAERRMLSVEASASKTYDVPEWIVPEFDASLGADSEQVLAALRDRAPVFLRVNLRKADRAEALTELANDGIKAEAVPGVETALRVVDGARKVARSGAFCNGLVEVQDASSQAAVAIMPLPGSGRILDYCAGGGGKSLAIAALCDAEIFAHDRDASRMKDVPARAARAGRHIECVETPDLAGLSQFDLVLCDVPCSGTGAWRRSPDARWRFSENDLQELVLAQKAIVTDAAKLVRRGGHLVYSTCSVLACENRDQIQKMKAEEASDWRLLREMTRLPNDEGDGFFCAVLERI